ncbi:MAG: class I SAM-dependent methyltransferase [Tyzzerella sp.]|nr:class I SAM-dependent methyltransferase [Tyzzerella sp.]
MKNAYCYGYDLLATDISPEAIAYCKELMPSHKEHFKVLNCVNEDLSEKFDFIYAVVKKKEK